MRLPQFFVRFRRGTGLDPDFGVIIADAFYLET